MIPYSEEKLLNSISYLANEHKKVSGKNLYKTPLLKYLALFYYKILKETGEPPFRANFLAMEKGPVHEEVYIGIDENLIGNGEFKVLEDSWHIFPYKSKKNKYIESVKYDLDYFSDLEIEVMDELIKEFATNYKNVENLIEATHKLEPWIKAWEARGNKKMNIITDDNIFDPESDSNSPAYQHYKTFKVLSEAETNSTSVW
ncbi:hypothetical protein LPTSP2_37650 [Leptospira ellinghausenii]|uniref:Antitoxin SocA-like Panacea domain-containing protein n=1 Tax=Leptospira ellinghausenii TaxID=1917822 RepID=A0A2P2DIJ5_9LEPT|nr:type II toxin-antitoxin system antitoxin SocA domain-containing protein [Leptospira ellinghausenii]GBF44462.1 hypothetical protein LPTSP2_37650 [Leptospira ellinghausenii]